MHPQLLLLPHKLLRQRGLGEGSRHFLWRSWCIRHYGYLKHILFNWHTHRHIHSDWHTHHHQIITNGYTFNMCVLKDILNIYLTVRSVDVLQEVRVGTVTCTAKAMDYKPQRWARLCSEAVRGVGPVLSYVVWTILSGASLVPSSSRLQTSVHQTMP